MKKRIFYTFILAFSFCNLNGQQKKILDSVVSISFRNESLAGALYKLESEVGVLFTYNDSDIKKAVHKVSGNFINQPVNIVLDELLKNSKIQYKFIGGQVVLYKIIHSVTISGYVRDSRSGEVLIGALVYVKQPFLGTTSNAHGFYSLSLPKNDYELFISYSCGEKSAFFINLNSDTLINIIVPSEISLNEVEVISGPSEDKVNSILNVDKVSTEDLKKLPAPFGEPDLIRIIQMLPGVQTTGEASLGYFVRGGSFSQNLVLLDDAPVYNPTHLMGIVSAFNTDMVKSVDFFKAGIPSVYQSGASSVLDVRAKDGNNQTFHLGGGTGLVSSRLFIEGPFKKEKSSFFLSGRKSLISDYFLKSGFYDSNLKVNYILNSKNSIFISAYSGKDNFKYDTSTTGWKNKTATLRYNHVFSGKLFSNTSIIYSKFSVDNSIYSKFRDKMALTNQFVENRIVKSVVSYFPKPNTSINIGVYYNQQFYSPFSLQIKTPDNDTTANLTLERKAIDGALFFDVRKSLSKRFLFNAGIRAALFQDKTSGKLFYYNHREYKYDSVEFRKKNFKVFEPRFHITYLINQNQSIKTSYNHINQFQQQFQGGALLSIAQVWLPSSSVLKPQVVDQFSLGYFFKKRKALFSIEVFYKTINHVTDFIEGAELFSDNFTSTSILNIETLLKEGKATSRGAEFSITKTEGRFTGWSNYTLSNTIYNIPEINNGKPYSSNFDNRHTISLGFTYKIKRKWEFAGIFNFKSGRAFSFPDSYYQLNGKNYNVITERNKERTPDYHRLDFSVSYKVESRNKKFLSIWVFSVMNIYNKFNPTYYRIDGREVTGYTYFPIFPALSYNFKL